MTEEATIRVRISARDAHYGGGLVAGATILAIFGDLATELTIRHDGDEGLLRAYEKVEFLAPVYAGDFIEATGRIVHVGNTSRRIELIARKVITPAATPEQPSAADVLPEPVVVARATAVTVVLKDRQRRR
ncbi:MAG: hotdog domain-containing protein [Chloroflexota bacterium]|nr:hotdog domain-containing protein [Chloroflexota bacterium]